MRQVNNSYQNIRKQAGAYYEYRVVLDGNYYGMNQLQSIDIDFALFEGNGPQIGNAYSAQCTIELLEESDNWPRMAQFDVESRLCSEDKNQQSRWFSLGKFYTDTRHDDTFGSLSIQAFDGMLKLEKSWTDKIPSEQLPTSWPITSRAYAIMIQTANLAQFEDLTQLDNTVSFVGLDTSTTIRDVLKTIAAAHGANWYMTANEKLRLVKFRNPPEITVEATTANYVYLGKAMESLERSPALAGISAVRLETIGGTVAYAGDNTGYQLNGNCEFSNINGIAELCLDNVSGYVYKPFTASNAYLDLITEPGDIVVADGNAYQVMRLSWQLGKMPVAIITADYDQEIDHEYTITSAQAKQYRKVMAATNEKLGDLQDEFSTAIQQTEQQINLIAESTVSQTEFEAAVESLQSQIDGNIQTWSGNVVPTLSNSPASDWATDDTKAEHVGDLYFVNSDAQIPEAGNYYRFEKSGDTYTWSLLTDSAISEALNKAAAAMVAAQAAQSTADSASTTAASKGKIWLIRPTPPYSEGDLWFDYGGNASSGEILTCVNSRSSGNYVSDDWKKRNKYTDDAEFLAFQETYQTTIKNITEQLDQKAETYYQEADPVGSWDVYPVGVFVVGVNKVGIVGSEEHKGDLWYRTSDNTTWFWNGQKWVQQDVPDEVFDKIDGKAQIFINTPYTPYHIGDLWFNSASSDIMTCINDRASGDYVASDWTKRNKYTDDTKANAVQSDLDSYKTVVSSEFSVQNAAISAKVSRTGGVNTSFGWSLTDTEHSWFSGNKEVMEINASGLKVYGSGEFTGKITASEGYIGTAESGFAITASAIYNSKSSMSAKSNGVYIGADGIALGYNSTTKTTPFYVTNSGAVTASNLSLTGGNISIKDSSGNVAFSVSNTGAVTATNMSITGGSISINNGAFYVDEDGNLYANSGSFGGSVWAANIKSDSVDGYGGSISGSAIAQLSIPANRVGNNVLTTGQFSTGVNASLGYANAFNSATQQGTSTYPDYFCAGQVVARSSFYSGTYYISLSGDTEGTINKHTHQISADSEGVVTIGAPDFLGNPHSFNIADTAFYKAAISAREITAITHVSEWESEDDIIYKESDKTVSGLFTLTAKHNDVGLKLVSNQKFTIPATKAYNAGQDYGASTVSVLGTSSLTITAKNAHKTSGSHHYVNVDITPTAQATKSDGTAVTVTNTINRDILADTVYSDAKTAYEPETISASQETTDGNVVWNSTNKTISADFTFVAKNAGGTSVLTTTENPITLPATKAYNAGQTEGEALGRAAVVAISASEVVYSGEYDFNPTVSNERTSYSGGYLRGAVNVELSNDKTYTLYVGIASDKAWDAGIKATKVNNFIVVANTASYYPIGTGHYLKCKVQGNVTGRLADGSTYTSDWTELDVYKYLYADPVYEAGYSNGETDFKPTAISAARETTDANVVWDSANKTISASFTLTAKNAAETAVYSQQEYAITLPATKAYNAGVTEGQVTGAESVIVSSADGVTYSGEYDFNPVISYSRTSYSDEYLYGAVNVKLSNDKTYTLYVKMDGKKAYDTGYQAHYDDGYHYTETEVSQIRSDEWSAGYVAGQKASHNATLQYWATGTVENQTVSTGSGDYYTVRWVQYRGYAQCGSSTSNTVTFWMRTIV